MLERALKLSQAFLPDVQVGRRAGKAGMAEQALDHRNLDPGLEQMGGKAVPQTMYPAPSRQLGKFNRLPVHSLSGGVGDGLVDTLPGRKEPGFRPVNAPVRAQFFQQAWGQQCVAILPAFAEHNPNLETFRFQMLHSQMARFIESQTGAVDRHQKRPGPRLRTADREKSFQFRPTEYLWTTNLSPHPWQDRLQRGHWPLLDQMIEAPQRTDVLIE